MNAPATSKRSRGALGVRIRSRLLLLGASHRTSALDERERLVRRVTYATLGEAAGDEPPWDDLVLLSTCNRVEIYAATRSPIRAGAVIQRAFRLPRASRALYRLQDLDAAAHLFRVASGLDSIAQGERQVADQVRRAPAERPETWPTNRTLDPLFARAARAASRIRVLAELDDPAASASQAAVRFLQETVGIPRPTVALIGSGKMARLAAKDLRDHAKIVVDRTPAKAVAVARELRARAASLREIRSVLQEADIVLAATSAVRPLVNAAALGAIMRRRPDRHLWIVDLGVPRNVDPKARDVAGVTYVDIDGLGPWAPRPPNPMALARAEARIRRESRDALEAPVGNRDDAVAALRQAAERFRLAELERALIRLPLTTDRDRAVLDKLTSRLVNGLLHGPTQRLRDIPEAERATVVHSILENWRDPMEDTA